MMVAFMLVVVLIGVLVTRAGRATAWSALRRRWIGPVRSSLPCWWCGHASGSEEGLSFYLVPDFAKLFEGRVGLPFVDAVFGGYGPGVLHGVGGRGVQVHLRAATSINATAYLRVKRC